MPVPIICLSNQLCGIRKLILGNIWVGFGSISNWHEGFPDGSAVKNPPANTGDASSIPGLRQSLPVGIPLPFNGSPLQHSYLENVTDRGQPGRLQSVGSPRVGQNSHWAHASTWYKQDVHSNVCPLAHDNIFRFLCFTCLWYIYLIICPWELMGDVNWKRNKCK